MADPWRWRGGRVPVLAAGKVADQGALFVGSLLIARLAGPDDFAPLAVLLIVNSLSVQLSDLGVGFAIHGTSLDVPLPGLALRRMRAVGMVAVVLAGIVAVLGSRLELVTVGVIWFLSAEAYVRKAAAVRDEGAWRVLRAEAVGAAVFLGAVAGAIALDAPTGLAVALVVKHLVEVVLLPIGARIDPARGLSSRREWFGQIATFAATNADYVVIGVMLSRAAFSIYLLAFRLVGALPALIAQALTQDTFVELAGGPPEARGVVLRAVRRRAAVVGSGGILLGLMALGVARVVLGADWDGLVVVGAILASAVPFRLLLGPSVAIAISSGRADLVVRSELARMVLTATGVALGATVGLRAAAVGSAAGAIAGILLLHVLVARSPVDASTRS